MSALVQKKAGMERRHFPRITCLLQLRSKRFSLLGSGKEPKTLVRGWIQNVSQGGVCLLSQRPIRMCALVHCEIRVSKTRFAIPTLMQARWIEKTPNGDRYRIGLQFLL